MVDQLKTKICNLSFTAKLHDARNVAVSKVDEARNTTNRQNPRRTQSADYKQRPLSVRCVSFVLLITFETATFNFVINSLEVSENYRNWFTAFIKRRNLMIRTIYKKTREQQMLLPEQAGLSRLKNENNKTNHPDINTASMWSKEFKLRHYRII